MVQSAKVAEDDWFRKLSTDTRFGFCVLHLGNSLFAALCLQLLAETAHERKGLIAY